MRTYFGVVTKNGSRPEQVRDQMVDSDDILVIEARLPLLVRHIMVIDPFFMDNGEYGFSEDGVCQDFIWTEITLDDDDGHHLFSLKIR